MEAAISLVVLDPETAHAECRNTKTRYPLFQATSAFFDKSEATHETDLCNKLTRAAEAACGT